jgi:1-aminocyclopropane-1-carboxylate deaminase
MTQLFEQSPFLSPLEKITDPLLDRQEVKLWIKRDDLLGEDDQQAYCGNKWRKLKYNLIQAREEGQERLLTFGGAYSNHIAAVASAGRVHGFQTIGIIRGERVEPLNPTLAFAEACGMELHFVSRSAYREKYSDAFITQLSDQLGPFFLVPEGGSNLLALKGAAELGREVALQFPEGTPDYVCVCCGTGGTLAGLIAGSDPQSKLMGFSVLKGDFLTGEVQKLLQSYAYSGQHQWSINTQYHFGGYAKFNDPLIDFINWFREKKGIQLDPIYTGKMMYGIWELIREGYFPNGSTIVAVHTGGLQGIRGFNDRFGHLIK